MQLGEVTEAATGTARDKVNGRQPPRADAKPRPSPPIHSRYKPSGDPFLDHYFRRIHPDVAATFTDEQRRAIKAMFAARRERRHAVDIRRSVPFGRGRIYLVLTMGREMRSLGRLRREGMVSGAFNLLAYLALALMLLAPVFLLVSLFKT